jgi:nucleosome binding factor SPN SPT16 subunit
LQVFLQKYKFIKKYIIFFKDDSEDEEKENSLPETAGSFGRGKRTAVIDQKLRQDTTAEEKRKRNQKELMETMNAKALKRMQEGSFNKSSFYHFIVYHLLCCCWQVINQNNADSPILFYFTMLLQ